METITAILTTHRRPALLLRALCSVAAETRRPDEILVVEDGEEPGLPELLAESGVPCRLVRRTLFSVSKARNLGLREASGDWVIYLDDDDVVYPERLACLAEATRRAPAPFVFGSTLKITPRASYRVPTFHPEGEGPSPFHHILRCMPHTNSTLFSRQALLDSGGFEEASSYFSDWCSLLRLADRAPGWRIPEVLSEFEAVGDGMTHAVARGNGMREKVLEAFGLLRLEAPEHARMLESMTRAVEEAEAFSSYDDYVALAVGLLPV